MRTAERGKLKAGYRRIEKRPMSNVQRSTSNAGHSAIRNPRFAIPRPSTFYRSTSYFWRPCCPIRLFEVGNPDWRPLGWAHALVVVSLTLWVIQRWGGWRAVRHFAFPVAFIFVAVPWVSPIEAPIVQGLMRTVAAIATETLALLGIPAQLEGSVIRISSGVVGVSEACSGVRSLQTSLMVGLLFGELKRLSVRRRCALVAAAAGIALVANCARTFFLVWIATRDGVPAVSRWHDIAGYAILGAVFLGTMGVSAALGRATEKVEGRNDKVEVGGGKSGVGQAVPRSKLSPSSFLLSTFLWLLLVEGGVELWYRAHERELVTTATWSVRWPESVPGFREMEIGEDVRSTLRYDKGREAVWPTTLADPTPNEKMTGGGGSSSMFFFRWEPGTTNILRARAHRPDVCLPNTGWRMAQDHGVRDYETTEGGALPFRHFAFVRDTPGGNGVTAHAFFCQREDRIPQDQLARSNPTGGPLGEWGRSDRVRVVQQGIRNQGQQVLEIVLTTAQTVDGAAAEEWFAQLVPEIVTKGDR